MIDLKTKPFCLSEEDERWVYNTLEALSVEEKIGQLFCPLFREGTIEDAEYIFSIVSPGGCSFRVLPKQQLGEYLSYLQKRSKVPMLVSANLETGGNGIITEGTNIGSNMQIAASDDPDMAYKLGVCCGREANAVGCNWGFSPVSDIDFNFRNPITNTRTFGSDPKRVRDMSEAYIRGLQENGVAAAFKHFPGDGKDERDQHLVATVNDCTLEEWWDSYGKVYRACIDAGALSCMVGHIMFPAYSRKCGVRDEDILPATLAKELIQDLLRKELGFNGLVVTDSTTMAAFTTMMPRSVAVPTAIAAGADMFLFAKNLNEDLQFMKAGIQNGILTEERLDEAVTRILALKAALQLHKKNFDYVPDAARESEEEAQHREWALECSDRCVTLVKEQPGVLPLTPDRYPRILLCPLEPKEKAAYYGGGNSGKGEVFADLLRKEGFHVELFNAHAGMEGKVKPTTDVTERYDAIVYLANLATRSNQTTVRIEWAEPMGANCPNYIHEVPTIFISIQNPYHLLDVPRVKTFINTYGGNESTLHALVEKLLGRSEFRGISPSDPFCGKWDTHL